MPESNMHILVVRTSFFQIFMKLKIERGNNIKTELVKEIVRMEINP